MSAKLISVPVFVEDSGETLILKLSPQDAERASTDMKYMTSLVNGIYEKGSQNLVNQLNVQTSIDQNNDIDTSTVAQSPYNDSLSSYDSFSSYNDSYCTPSPESQASDVHNPKEIINEKSLFVWPSKCIYLLLEKYEEREGEFTKGTKRHNKIWEDIADEIKKINIEYSVSGSQCQSKFNGLKKTYKKILDHNSVSGNDRKTWPYFERMHEIFGKTGWANPKAIASEVGPCSQQETVSNIFLTDDNKRKSNKRKIETVLDDFMSNMKEEKKQREKKRETKETWFQELREQRERQHQEKIAIMQKLLEVIAKK